ncbi:NADH dehydrogenase [ubiquinone] 1 alpha subcomplex assembly factor 2-like [Styela clava]
MLRRGLQAISKSLRLEPDKICKGRDFIGNIYYETPPQKYYFGLKEVFKTRRSVDTPVKDPHQRDIIESGRDIPTEWLSWLQGRRKLPPTELEVENNLLRMRKMKEKVKFLDEQQKKERDIPKTEVPKPKKKDPDQAEVESWDPK